MAVEPPGRGFDAIVLAGGGSARMGRDKLAARVGGRSLLQRVVDACQEAGKIVVVGPRRPLEGEVVWAREEPPGSGPAAAVAAGLAHVGAGVVVVLAGELPMVSAATVARLVHSAGDDRDGALLLDELGLPQPLAAAYRTGSLRRRVSEAGALGGTSVRALIEGLELTPVPVGTEGADVDTPADLAAARLASLRSGQMRQDSGS